MTKLTLIAGALATLGLLGTTSDLQAQDRLSRGHGRRHHERGFFDLHHGDYVDQHRGFYLEAIS